MSEVLINKPKTKRGEITFNKLTQSAEENFYQKGYHETSISDITRSAHVALGTYYVYFQDKLSVYKYLLLQYSHDIRKNIALSIRGLEDRREIERAGLKSFLVYISEHKHIYNIIWESLYIDKQLFVDYYTNFAHAYETQIIDAQNKQEMKQFDPQIASYLLMGVANFIGLKWVMFDDSTDFDAIVDETIRILDIGMFAHDKSSETEL